MATDISIQSLFPELRNSQMTTNKQDRNEGRSANIGFAKWRVKCFYESFVQSSSSVFQMKFCAKNPPLRKAENRYRAFSDDRANNKN